MNASLLFWFVVPDANFISLSAATSGENPVVEVVAGVQPQHQQCLGAASGRRRRCLS
jgi:hypothetical protein